MYKTRKIGLGLAMVFGIMATAPVLADQPQAGKKQAKPMKPAKAQAMRTMEEPRMAPAMSGPDPCVAALNDVRAAQATVTQLQQLGAEIKARHAQLEANAVVADDTAAPMKCPACGMMMPTKATTKMTKAVKYNGKTYFCCQGCDMSASADKE